MTTPEAPPAAAAAEDTRSEARLSEKTEFERVMADPPVGTENKPMTRA